MLTLREWRKAKEISQQKIADSCGIHVNTYIEWEKHPEKIPIGQAYVIALSMGVPLSDISFSPSLQNVDNSVVE